MKYEYMNSSKWKDLRRVAGYAHVSNGSEVEKLLGIADRLLRNSKVTMIPSRKLVFGLEMKLLSREYNRVVTAFALVLAVFFSAPLYYFFFEMRPRIEFWPLLPTLAGLGVYGILLKIFSKEGILHDVNLNKYSKQNRESMIREEEDIVARYSQAANFLDDLGHFPIDEDIWEATKYRMGELAFNAGNDDGFRSCLKNFIGLVITLRLHTENLQFPDNEIADKLYAKAFKDSANFVGLPMMLADK